jgi:nitrite reductase/ring-hydroxylating ferredoxin subunit/uncharacterized membrane protein
MKSRAVAFGHPMHPMLIPFPLAFLAGGVVFDLAAIVRDSPEWWTTGGYLGVAGLFTAGAAAIPGFIDYLYTVPPRSSGKTRATKHLLSMLMALALFVGAWWLRADSAARTGMLTLALEIIALGFLTSGAYMGGTLVTRNLIGIDHRYAEAGQWREETFTPSISEPLTVARHDELKQGQMKLLRIGDIRVVLARSENGHVAFDDRCTHRGGSLAGGVLICGTVQCLWHGSQFDVTTGKVKSGPATAAIGVYRIIEEAGDVKLIL